MSSYQKLKTEFDEINSAFIDYNLHQREVYSDLDCTRLDCLYGELRDLILKTLSTIKELEPTEIDPEFFDWQTRKFNFYPLSTKVREVYKEKSDGTRVRVGLLYNDDDLALYKPNNIKNPKDNPKYIEGLNWSIYWFYLDNEGKKVKFQPSNRVNETFEDPWSIYEFNALGYQTSNGTIVYYDSYLEE